MSEDHDSIVIARLRDTAENIHSRGPVIAAQHLRDAADRIAGQRQQIEAQAQNKALLAGLWKLGYHPDMDLDEWADARVKQRDDLEQEAKVLAEVKRMVLASGRSMNNLSLPQVMSEILADAAAMGDANNEAAHHRDRAAQYDGDIRAIAAGRARSDGRPR